MKYKITAVYITRLKRFQRIPVGGSCWPTRLPSTLRFERARAHTPLAIGVPRKKRGLIKETAEPTPKATEQTKPPYPRDGQAQGPCQRRPSTSKRPPGRGNMLLPLIAYIACVFEWGDHLTTTQNRNFHFRGAFFNEFGGF